MLGTRVSYEAVKNEVTCRFEQGSMKVSVLTPEIIRVYAQLSGQEHISRAIEGEKATETAFLVTEEKDCWSIETDAVRVCIYDEGYVDFYKKDGTPLCEDYRGKRIFK